MTGRVTEDLPTAPVLRGLAAPTPVGIHGVGTSPSASPPLARGLSGRLIDEVPPQCPKCRTQVRPVEGKSGRSCPLCGTRMEHRRLIALDAIFEDAVVAGKTSYTVPSPTGLEDMIKPPRKADEIDAEWIEGVRKGWKLVYQKALDLKNEARPPTAATDPMEFIRYLGQMSENALTATLSLVTFLRNLRSILTVEKGFWTSSDTPQKSKKKLGSLEQPVAKVHAEIRVALEELKAALRAAKMAVDTYKPGGYAENDLTSGGTYYNLLEPERYSKRGPFDRLGDIVGTLWDVDLGERFGEVDDAMRRLFLHLGKLVKAFGFAQGKDQPKRVSFGSYEPSVVKVEGFTVIFQDTPEDTRKLHGKPGTPDDPAQDMGYRGPEVRSKYINSIKYAAGKLRQFGLGHLLYGKIAVLPRSYGISRDLEVKGFGKYAAATYHRDGDYIQAYSDPKPGFSSTIVHELGHRYFAKFMSAQDRENFKRWFGRSEATSTYGASDPEEDFTELFASYIMGPDWKKAGGKELTRDQRQRMEAFLGKKRKLEMKAFKNMMRMVEAQLPDGEVRRREFEAPFSSKSTDVMTPGERQAVEGFVLDSIPVTQRYTSAMGEEGIVYYDERGRAVSGIVAQMDDSELLRVAYARGYVPPAPDTEPGDFTVAVAEESLIEKTKRELAEVVG